VVHYHLVLIVANNNRVTILLKLALQSLTQS
jgi:hypothetical protein